MDLLTEPATWLSLVTLTAMEIGLLNMRVRGKGAPVALHNGYDREPG